MIIQIESGDAQSKRKVTVTPDEGEPYSFTAENIKEAHKVLKVQRAEGWAAPVEPKGKK